MKKIAALLIFLFLTGLFSGLFFSTNLSSSANAALSELLLNSMTSSDVGFCRGFVLSLASNLTLCIVMLPAVLSRYLRPLPGLVLLYKGFSIGFCSGLLYINAGSRAFLLSMLKIFPQNIFIIPALLLLAFTIMTYRRHKKSRSASRSGPLCAFAISFALLIMGAVTEAALHPVAL